MTSALRIIAGASIAAALALLACALLTPGLLSLHVPLDYGGDGLSHAMLVKTVLETGWFPSYNPRLGAPFGAASFDYPTSDGANLLMIKLLGMISADWIVVTNLFFLAGLALCAATAFLVMHPLGLRFGSALVGATLFALLPYRFLRPHHLFLVAYWSVPLAIYLAVVCSSANVGIGTQRKHLWPLILVLLGVLVGSGGVYYAFFAVLLIAAVGACNALVQRSWRGGLRGLVVIGVIGVTVAANVAPSLIYWHANGRNEQVAHRSAAEAEFNGFKPIQLLLPQREHRLQAARRIAEEYRGTAPLVNENATAALGVVGVTGLLVLIAHGLLRVLAQRPQDPVIDTFAGLAALAIAIGTIGGLGSIVAYAGFTSIRAYNRISVFLAFLGIAALLWTTERIAGRAPMTQRSTLRGIMLVAVLGCGLFDQVPARPLHIAAPSLATDRAFFAAVERELLPRSAVYQLPYHAYPEAGPVSLMEDYGLSRGYLNTEALRWSYGAMKGRPADTWLHALSKRTTVEQLDIAAQSGFGAVYIDRRGYPDKGASIVGELSERLGEPLVSSNDGELIIWKMSSKGSGPLPLERVAAAFNEPIDLSRSAAPPYVERIDGFTGAEPWGQWMLDKAKITLLRPLPKRFSLRLDTVMALQPVVGQPVRVRVGDVTRTFQARAEPGTTEIPFTIDAESRSIEFDTPAAVSPSELGIGDDWRSLAIGVRRIAIVPAP